MSRFLCFLMVLVSSAIHAQDMLLTMKARAALLYSDEVQLMELCRAGYNHASNADSCRLIALRFFNKYNAESERADSIFYASSKDNEIMLEYACVLAQRNEFDSVKKYVESYLQTDYKKPKSELLLIPYLDSFWESVYGRSVLRNSWYSKEELSVAELKYALAKEQFAIAEGFLQQVSVADQSFFEALIFDRKGKVQAALHMLTKVTKASRMYINSLHYSARLALRLEKYKNAIIIYEKLIAEGVGIDYLYKDYVYSLLQLNRYDDARSVLNYQLQAYPTDYFALSQIAGLEMHAGQYLEALSLLNRAIQINAGCDECYVARAEIFRVLERHEKAFSDLSMALDINPFSPQVLIRRGKLRLETGDKEGACADFKRASIYGGHEASVLFSACNSE